MSKKFEINIKTIFSKRGVASAISGLKSIGKAARTAGRSMGKLWNVKPILYFRRAVVGAFAAIGIGGVKAASDMESLRAQLEAVLGDAEKAKAAFDESFDFSVATPFSPEDIVKTRIALESVGVTGKDAVEKTATAAAAMGRNILDVASAVRSMETEPLRNLGIMLKKNGDEFIFNYKDKMQKARTVSANGFAEAQQTLLDIMGGRFEGGLEKMSQTFSGLWSTMVGNLKASLADFGEQYLPSVKQGVQSVIDALNNLRSSGKLKEWGQAVNTALQDAAENITGLLQYIRTEGGTAFKDIAIASKDVVSGLFRVGAEEAAAVLAAWAPRLGASIGKSAKELFIKGTEKKAFFKSYKNASNPRTRENFTDDEIEELWVNHQSKQGGASVERTGAMQLQNGINQFAGMALTGNSRADATKVATQQRAQALAEATTQKEQVMAEAKALYGQQRGQQNRAASDLAVAKLHGSDVAGAQQNLEKQRAETALAADLVRAVKDGDDGLTITMITILRLIVDEQVKQDQQLQQVASQVKNGRS